MKGTVWVVSYVYRGVQCWIEVFDTERKAQAFHDKVFDQVSEEDYDITIQECEIK